MIKVCCQCRSQDTEKAEQVVYIPSPCPSTWTVTILLGDWTMTSHWSIPTGQETPLKGFSRYPTVRGYLWQSYVPARWAICTQTATFLCSSKQRPVTLRGSIPPSERINWLSSKTSWGREKGKTISAPATFTAVIAGVVLSLALCTEPKTM